ncbi:MAG: ABC transporter ATP-binding protein, partial [Rhodanobacteraceae bacterium]
MNGADACATSTPQRLDAAVLRDIGRAGAGPNATPLLEIDGATVLRDGRPIIDDLQLRVAPRQHTVIVGPNGAGKSTLVKLVARQVYPLARDDGCGRVRVFGRERWNVTELRGRLGIVSPALQLEYSIDTTLTAFDAVVSGFLSAQGLGLDLEHQVDAVMRARAAAALVEIGAAHLAQRHMASLSTGEARRVLIARALVHHPQALLLDEPCAGLDLASRRRFLRRLQDLARGGTTLLLVTHHVEEILPEVEQAVLLRSGRVFAAGTKRTTL